MTVPVTDPASTATLDDDGKTITLPLPPPNNPDPVLKTAQGFTADDIEAARKQEKDKLYADQQKLKEAFAKQEKELADLRKAREDEEALRLKTVEDKKASDKSAAEEEMSAKELIALRDKDWQTQLDDLKKQADMERALFAKERDFVAKREYTQILVEKALADGELAPELADLVTGTTEEEIQGSLNVLKAKSSAIAANVAAATQQQRLAPRGVSPTGYAPTGPLDNEPGQQTITLEQLKAMPPQEYAKIRAQLIGGAATNQNRGMYS